MNERPPRIQEKDASSEDAGGMSPESKVASYKPTRREILQGIGAVSLLATGIVAPSVISHQGRRLYGESYGKETISSAIEVLRQKLREQHGVEVDFSPLFPHEQEMSIDGDPVEYLTDKKDILEAMDQAFEFYPHHVPRQAHFGIIRILNNTVMDTRDVKAMEVGGIATGMHRARNDGVMYINYARTKSKNDSSTLALVADALTPTENKQEILRTTFHHEMAHLIDDIDDASWSENVRGIVLGKTFFKSDLPYLYDDEIDYLVTSNQIDSKLGMQLKMNTSGFARIYGKRNADEDRATIAEALFSDQQSLLARAEKDLVLKNKVTYMKRHYFIKSFGVMDAAYWKYIQDNGQNPTAIGTYIQSRTKQLLVTSNESLISSAKSEVGIELTVAEIEQWKEQLRTPRS